MYCVLRLHRHTVRIRAQRGFSTYISMPRIALVDNEIELRREVATFLRSHGHQVTELESCAELRGSVATAVSDILVVDRTLPDGDGLHVVGELMQKHREMGVIMFTARGTQSERLDGLRQGVDHYLNKTVPLEELQAVIHSLSRRISALADWRIDPTEWVLMNPEGQRISLTRQEYQLLDQLNNASSRYLTRAQIVLALGKHQGNYDARSLDVLVSRLRKKVSAVTRQPLPLKTVHGTGYSLSIPLSRYASS
jgi:two-component system, OmpR family, response regulator